MPFDMETVRSRLAGLDRAEATELRQEMAALARPRLTGSEGAAEVEGELRERFEARGYEGRALDFSFSTVPGRFGATASGVLLAVAGLAGAAVLVAGLPGVALVILVLGAALALLPLVLLEDALEKLPWGRVETANLLFTRPGARPSWILMAHRDSKSQLVPSLVRTGGLALAAAGWAALVLLAGLWLGAEVLRFPGAVLAAGGALALGGLVLALGWTGNASPGALDNASGLAALLAVARRLGDPGDVAFLVTDGEELGLAGARAVVDRLPAVQGVINLDGLDDGGPLYVAEGYGLRRGGTAPQLAAALLTAAAALELPVERRPLPRSMMVDHLPIAAAGVPALTVMRGGWSSLARVHRPADGMDRLTGRGAAETVTLLAAAIALLRAPERPHLASGRATGS